MKTTKLAVLALALGILTGCSSKRDTLTYFQDLDVQNFTATASPSDYEPKIEPLDELNISVTSILPEVSAPYNLPLVNPALSDNDFLSVSTVQQSTYFVSPEGDITMPVLGRIHVAGMTTQQLAQYLEKRISQDIDDPTVVVNLVNFKINVAGEVTHPGQYSVKGKHISILDALALAGDLSPYGERENILIIREENGKRVAGQIDLTKADALSSPYFYLKQNDYVYVSPNKIRMDNAKYNQNNAYKLTVISTVVSAASVIASLVIALTIK